MFSNNDDIDKLLPVTIILYCTLPMKFPRPEIKTFLPHNTLCNISSQYCSLKSVQKISKHLDFPSDDKSEHQTQGIPTTDRTLHFAAALTLRICLPPMMKMTPARLEIAHPISNIISDPTEIRFYFEYTSRCTQTKCQHSII